MKLSDYQKITFTKFNGWYSRGDDDSCPPDHAIECKNVWLNDPGNIGCRPGIARSFVTSHEVIAQFVATPKSESHYITMDPYGQFYREFGTSSVMLNMVDPTNTLALIPFRIVGARDFVGLNMFGRTYFNVIKAPPSGPGITVTPEPIKVYDGTYVRNAAGQPPVNATQMSVGYTAGAGRLSLGLHYIAVVFLTETGFLTMPGPVLSLPAIYPPDPSTNFNPSLFYSNTGNERINLGAIPSGPIGTKARQLVMTKGNEKQFFIIPSGFINDNYTNTWTIVESDLELLEDASYLFDNIPTIPGGIGDGGLLKYHGRMLSWGGEADLIRVSYSGDPETVSDVTGYIQLPTEFDGNYVKGGFILRDVLYLTKGVGIFSTQDLSGDEPGSWPITAVDGSKGSWNSGISTLSSSVSGMPMNDNLLLLDWEGIHVFNGSVQQPALTWKINDVWKAIDRTKFQQITICVDPFQHLIYVLVPTGYPYNFLVGDYSEGLDAKNIKWMHWDLPIVAQSLALANVQDADGVDDWNYYPRLGTYQQGDGNWQILKISPKVKTDLGVPFTAKYQLAYTPIDLGSLNTLRGVRVRAKGSVDNSFLSVGASVQDVSGTTVSSGVLMSAVPIKDYFIEFNIMNEKFSISLSGISTGFNISRVDMFGTTKVKSRPQ